MLITLYFIFVSRTGTFPPKMGIIKDRNSKDLIEAEEIKKRWQDYTEELYKKDLKDPDNHDGVVSHPEPDILKCEVKWPIGSTTANKASEGDRIPAELFEILKNGAIKVLHSICQQSWKSWQWPQDWKRSIFIPIPKKGSTKECSNCRTIDLISHAVKVTFKILQSSLKQYVNRELPDVQTGKYDNAVYCHPVYLTYMQSTCEIPGWMNYKLVRFLGEISTTSGMQMIPL